MPTRLIHDAAFSTARVCLEVVELCLPPEHLRDVFDEYYEAIKAGIEAYEAQRERTQQRLEPGNN
jgi:hypothetical protein